jgi:BirA family biotin operon repressor/biotin-[acetyl-CoA-carboxylase] ligase
MSTVWREVLELLADGELVSGAVIGNRLGISRTAVWKHLRQLQEWGVPVITVKGRGYLIDGGMELLSHPKILAEVAPQSSSLLRELELLSHVDSTNTIARQQFDQGLGSGYVCMAERQTQGRGRLGRSWVSPFGRNMYFSANWEFHGGAVVLEGLSLAVGVAVCRAIRSFGVDHVALKWPNDVLLNGRKVGGILLEMVGDPLGPCQIVVGIGINFAMPDHVTIDQPWADLAAYPEVTRNGLAGRVISELLPLLANYAELGFIHYKEEWEGYDAHDGAKVQLSFPGKVIEGIARGVSASGAICIEIDGAQQFFSGGEISLKRLA